MRQASLYRIVFIVMALWLSILGATWSALLSWVELQPITLIAFGGIVILWLISHRRRTWYRTPLDLVFVLWGGVIAISIVTNMDTWRRSADAVWFVLLYMLVWYLLTDVIAHKRLRRVDVLIGLGWIALVQVLFAGVQLFTVWSSTGDLARPVGLLGNTNTFGTLLITLIPMFLTYGWFNRNIRRWSLWFVGAIMLILTLLTTSRGAWLGLGGGLVIWFTLMLAHYNLLSQARLKTMWQSLSSTQKRIIQLSIASLGIAILVLGVLFINSFSIGGRTLDLRTFLWQSALSQFAEQPITGNGLFTYGHHLPRFTSIPVQQPHSHAHGIPFTVIAEMGILGMIALGISVVVILRMMWQNWQVNENRPLFIATIAGTWGYGVHHLFDTTAMLPVIALLGIVMLTVTVTPIEAKPMLATWRQRGHPFGMGILWASLLIIGMWQANLHQTYLMIVREALTEDSWTEMGESLTPLIESDPDQAVFWVMQGYAYGRASITDDNTLPLAIQAYERYLELEPYHAPNWANLASLYWQDGDIERAQASIGEAVRLAPDWEFFERVQSIYRGDDVVYADIAPPAPPVHRDGANFARFQFLHDIAVTEQSGEYLPQLGRGTD